MRPAPLTSAEASRILALCDYAISRDPVAPFAFLRGFLVYASILPLPHEAEAAGVIAKRGGRP